MTYPPDWRIDANPDLTAALVRAHPFAHFITAHGGPHSTRIPVIADFDGPAPVRLRAHLNGQNPQVNGLDGQDVLLSFSGPSTYVSPNWRSDHSRAGTYDYQEVQVRGIVRVSGDIAFFRQLIDDLAALIEPQYAEIGDYPLWQTSMSPPGYVERLFPAITAFSVEVRSVRTVSKLHQAFPEPDRRSVADHLARSRREDARTIAALIRSELGD